jgi:hypothetical protein
MSAIFGYQFSRGKWLRLISGNTFLPDKELKTPEMSAFAKCVGKTMYSAVILVIAIAAEVYISKHFAGYSWIGTLIFIAAMALLFVSLIVAVLNHPQIKSRKRKR